MTTTTVEPESTKTTDGASSTSSGWGATNAVVLRGVLSRDVTRRELESGDVLFRYEVTISRDDGPADTVPVAWIGSGPKAPAPAAKGDEVFVLGRVRRRFWRGGGGLQSTTEVVADEILGAGQRRRIGTALRRFESRAT